MKKSLGNIYREGMKKIPKSESIGKIANAEAISAYNRMFTAVSRFLPRLDEKGIERVYEKMGEKINETIDSGLYREGIEILRATGHFSPENIDELGKRLTENMPENVHNKRRTLLEVLGNMEVPYWKYQDTIQPETTYQVMKDMADSPNVGTEGWKNAEEWVEESLGVKEKGPGSWTMGVDKTEPGSETAELTTIAIAAAHANPSGEFPSEEKIKETYQRFMQRFR